MYKQVWQCETCVLGEPCMLIVESNDELTEDPVTCPYTRSKEPDWELIGDNAEPRR